MANKPRPPMTKPDEVIAWATETVSANGEAFTMLNKEEQLLIAKFLLAMRDHIKKLQNKDADEAMPDRKQEEPADITTETPKEEYFPTKDDAAAQTDEIETEEERVVVEGDASITHKQTNMEYFKANAVPMQRAYQLFQTWQDCDPTNRMILDGRRKAYINSAAFAFWLNLPHE